MEKFEKEDSISLNYIYNNCSQKSICNCPKKYNVNWDSEKQLRRCSYCDGQGKPDINKIRNYFEKYDYKLISTKYTNDSDKLNYECPVGHKHSMRWGNFRYGKRCPDCSKIEQNLQISGSNHLISLSEIRDNYNIKSLEDAEKCELLYDTSNGITLCRKCHKTIHDKFYIKRRFKVCLRSELMEQLSGLNEPFIEAILCRNPSNSGKPQTDNAVGNPERSLEKGTCNDQSEMT